jgi:hypothetical protein
MSKTDMVRAYAETLLKEVLGVETLKQDPDGDYPVRYESALYYVRIHPGTGDDPVVQVFAVALADVEPSPDLFARVNAINADLRFARAFWVKNQVLFESEMVGLELSLAGFEKACRTVGGAADYFGTKLSEEFGGRTAFAEEQDPGYEPPRNPPAPGLYL